MNALIVCHAGAGLGLGHLTRSLVVARAIHQQLGAKVHLLIQGDPVQRADLDEFEHHFLGGEEDLLHAIRQQVRHADAQVVILDLHPRLVPSDIGGLLEELRQGSCKAISIDGLVNHRSKLDLVFIPSFHFSPPAGSIGAAPILFGWDSFLLNVKRAPIEWKLGGQVLALTGGSDATGLGKTLPTLLNEAFADDTELHWITGPYAQQPVWPAFPRFSMVNHQSLSGLDDLMVEANYAVTVYGVSFFELLYYGVPTVVFSPYGGKDDAELAVIAKEGVALVAKDEIDAVGKLKELMEDHQLAASLSQRARQRMSAKGGQKLAHAIAMLFAY
jgi:spore coat polysaccharide biosynthesis predicted glycosyltransferase SpsG